MYKLYYFKSTFSFLDPCRLSKKNFPSKGGGDIFIVELAIKPNTAHYGGKKERKTSNPVIH